MDIQPKIKLLIIIPNLECGGSEKFISVLCNHINTGKFDITLGVLNNQHPFYKINNPLIEIIDFKIKRVRHSLIAILKIIKQKQPDIIFSSSNHLNLYLAIFRRIFSKKIKMIARESSIVNINNRRTKFPGIYRWLIKKFYQRFDCIICQSVFMQEDLITNFNIKKDKTIVIYNPVEDVEESKMIIPAIESHSKIYKFISVARLSEEKGFDRLIRSVAELTIPFQYFIIGDGDKRKELQQLIDELHLEDKIFLEGKRTNPFEGFEDADFYLMGSYYEGLPNSLLEAGLLGIPVIAFDVPGGINEIIFKNENGVLVKDDDENTFANAFANALQNAVHLNFNRNIIHANTRQHFSVNTIIPLIESLFLQLNENK